MGWIPHLMILDDDPRVLESLIPSVVDDLARGLAKSRRPAQALRLGDPGGSAPIHVKVSAHGYEASGWPTIGTARPTRSTCTWSGSGAGGSTWPGACSTSNCSPWSSRT